MTVRHDGAGEIGGSPGGVAPGEEIFHLVAVARAVLLQSSTDVLVSRWLAGRSARPGLRHRW